MAVPSLPQAVAEEVRAAAAPGRGERAVRALEEAVALLEAGRPAEALRRAEEAKALAHRSGAVREVLGMALYGVERFRDALRELLAYRRMTGRLDQNHLIADCHRALGAPDRAVEAAREALRASVPEEVRAEATVVGAAALADLGRYDEALALLRSFPTRDDVARPFDLRVWYMAGDVLERAGRPREAAREFARVVRHDPEAFDAGERLARLAGTAEG
ncbi:MAG TPA: tetratricopeptide repeat protein [Actinomycetota bacterium]|nr:tetratricopeptide repeat protein [Actinomycetota bacterium]